MVSTANRTLEISIPVRPDPSQQQPLDGHRGVAEIARTVLQLGQLSAQLRRQRLDVERQACDFMLWNIQDRRGAVRPKPNAQHGDASGRPEQER